LRLGCLKKQLVETVKRMRMRFAAHQEKVSSSFLFDCSQRERERARDCFFREDTPRRRWVSTEQTVREAQTHMAIVFLAPKEKYFAALGPDSLSHTEPHHPRVEEIFLKSDNVSTCLCGSVV